MLLLKAKQQHIIFKIVLKNIDVKITKLAQGLPVGGEIESLDDGTLFSAFKNRSKLNSD